jgi:hypothetical protein
MNARLLTLCLAATALMAPSATRAETAAPAPAPLPVIFDTDIGGDIDDAGAMAVLHALADGGEIRLLAVGVVNGHANTVPYTDAINTWFGRPDLPVGTIKTGAPINRDTYMAGVVAAYPHDLTRDAAPDAVTLYRKILAAQPDGSVTLVAVGPATNISRLLASGPDDSSPLSGADLVARKVRFYAAGGNGGGGLPKGKCGWNYAQDVAAARDELARLPATVPTVFAGGSGEKLKIGNCYRDAPPDHIIRRSYEAYFAGKTGMDRPTWDQLRVLYACRPSLRDMFQTSPPGDITLGEDKIIAWSPEPARNRAYAYVKDLDAMRAVLTPLMMHQPASKAAPAPQP